MRQQDRLGFILERLSQHNSVDVSDLADELAVSQASVRRDLQLLESQQLLTRTHGGAVASGVLYELPMRYRGGQRHEAKRAIAKLAAGPARRTTSPRSASTAARPPPRWPARWPSRSGLRVVTNALNIAAELAVRANIELVVCGGQRPQRVLRAGRAARRADPEQHQPRRGDHRCRRRQRHRRPVSTHHEVEAQTNRSLLRAAARVIVVADSSKIGRRGFARIAEITAATDLVTDDEARRERRRRRSSAPGSRCTEPAGS